MIPKISVQLEEGAMVRVAQWAASFLKRKGKLDPPSRKGKARALVTYTAIVCNEEKLL